MAAYNEQDTIEQAIESIITQTFKNWHLVVVDDCSTDNTHSILKTYAHKLPGRMTIYRNKNNLGLAESLIKGISFCKAKAIARMDADDICKPYRFLRQYQFLESHPEIASVSGALEYIDEKGNVFGRTYPITSPRKIRKKVLQGGNVIVHSAVMMRRDAFVACGGYCAGLTTAQDQHLWMKFLHKGYQLAMLPVPMISYRVCGKAISNRKKTEKQIRLMKEILQYDEPSRDLIDAFRREVKKNKGRFVSQSSRRAQIVNTIHCKIWRMSRKFRISEKLTPKVVCGLQNFLA